MLFLLKHPAATAYRLYTNKPDTYNDSKQAWRDFGYLKKIALLKISEVKLYRLIKKKKIEKIPYCLSLNGIFYILLHNPEPFNEKIILSLLQNYGSCLLFTLFFFPLST